MLAAVLAVLYRNISSNYDGSGPSGIGGRNSSCIMYWNLDQNKAKRAVNVQTLCRLGLECDGLFRTREERSFKFV